MPQLVDAAAPVVADAPAMRLRVAGAGRFGSRRRPQVAWAGVAGDVVPLGELAAGLARVARAQRLEVEERPFRPHLTLGRWRPGRPADGDLVDRLSGYTGPVWPVRELRLVESRLGPRPEYVTVASWSVGDQATEAIPPSPGPGT